MKYMGSKARIAKHILPIILKDRKDGQWYVEPFVGGANVIDKVNGNRIGADSNKYLIALLQGLQVGWRPDIEPTKENYDKVRENKCEYSDRVVGYFGFLFSFGAKFFGGFVETKSTRDRVGESIRNGEKTGKSIKGITFTCGSYNKLTYPRDSIIYCDPPYAGTTKYKDNFDHDKFWEWCRDKVKEGHQVFISEYNAPDDFVCVWQQDLNVTIARNGKPKKATEKLFVHKSQFVTPITDAS